jgi:hypothetical protein
MFAALLPAGAILRRGALSEKDAGGDRSAVAPMAAYLR